MGACSGDSSPTGTNTLAMEWGCHETVETATGTLVSCDCYGLEPGMSLSPPGPGSAGTRAMSVTACGAYSCCLLVAAGYDSTCHCENFAASCAAEAASRPGSQVVANCPPGSSPPPPACSAPAENCSASYLAQKGYSGCCAGLTCAQNASGVMACQ